MEIQFTVFSLHKKCTYNFATTKFVLLPGFVLKIESVLNVSYFETWCYWKLDNSILSCMRYENP